MGEGVYEDFYAYEMGTRRLWITGYPTSFSTQKLYSIVRVFGPILAYHHLGPDFHVIYHDYQPFIQAYLHLYHYSYKKHRIRCGIYHEYSPPLLTSPHPSSTTRCLLYLSIFSLDHTPFLDWVHLLVDVCSKVGEVSQHHSSEEGQVLYIEMPGGVEGVLDPLRAYAMNVHVEIL